ncbi:MAG: hypothetical protein Q9228_002550 [Teloschistes exilis]
MMTNYTDLYFIHLHPFAPPLTPTSNVSQRVRRAGSRCNVVADGFAIEPYEDGKVALAEPTLSRFTVDTLDKPTNKSSISNMKVFVTGAAGFIGKSTVRELTQNGHQVLGLSRSDANTTAITEAGGSPHSGSLEDVESLKSGAQAADAVIHLAFIHDFSDLDRSTAVDRTAVAAIGEVLTGTGKPFIVASGTLGMPPGEVSTEETQPMRNMGAFSERIKAADIVQELAKNKNVRGMLIRFSPTVHGKGDGGFVPRLIDMSRQAGTVLYTGDGSSRWPAVHRDDAAVLLRLALEKGTAGSVYNAVGEQGVSMKDIMTLIGKRLDLPVKGVSVEEAAESMSFFAHVISMDNPTSSEKTQKELGWQPVQPGLLKDMEANYF